MKQQSNLICKLLLLLLMLAGTSSAWARTSTYKIVNNKGEVVMHVKGTTASPQLPVKAQSPFATNYRYYRNLEDAQLDASSGADAAAASRLTGNLTYDGDVFVRYSYEPNGNVKDHDGKTLRIDGNAVYNFTICDYPGGTDASKKQPIVGTPGGRYVYYNSSSEIHHSSLPAGIYEKIHIAPYNTTNTEVTGAPDEASKKTKAYQWRFVGQRNGYEGAQGLPDPYDIRIINVADNSKVLTGIYTRTYDQGPSTQQYIHLTLLAPDNDATHVQRFFIRKLSNTVQIAACAPLYLYLGGTTQKDMWFVLNKEPNEYLWTSDANSFKEHDCFQTLHMRIHTKQENANNIDGGSERRSALKFYRLTTRKYIILDDAGNKLAAANATADEMDQLQVPASIASALPGTSYQYWTNKNKTGEITTNENLPDVVYVTYSFNPNTVGNPVDLNGDKAYNMKLNGNFVKYQVGAGDDSDVTVGTAEASDADEYVWLFKGGDPYKIQLTSAKTGAGYITGESTGSTISLHTGGRAAALKSNATASGRTPSTYYLVKSPAYTNENPVYLLRATYVGEGETSADDDDDPNFYTWSYGGDASDWNESQPRLYSSAFKEDVDADLQIQLDELLATPVTYHIIDKTKHEDVIQASTRKIPLDVPASIKSPLVSQFYYYDTFANAQTDNRSTGIISSTTSGADIYVTYDVGSSVFLDVVDSGEDRYKLKSDATAAQRKKGPFYLLRFLNGQYYQQEDGSNGITTETKKAEIPYSNGDANMNVYDMEFTNNTFKKGAGERTRMPWAFIGGDPYRLKVSSYQSSHKHTINSVDVYGFTYFRTYYNETIKQIITTNVTDDPYVTTEPQFGNPEAVATEYMVLGSTGRYKLMTTNEVSDGTTTEHRTVHTFEQYWKNYETIQEKLGGGVMPADADLTARGWHKYPAWANSKPLDGSSKTYDYLTHWYQTFEMGEEFDLVEVSLEPSLVLIDNHGWEVMRSGLPVDITKVKEAKRAEEEANNANKRAFIAKFNSPMVKEYHWYTGADKVTDYHKYSPKDPALTESGDEEFVSTDLNTYPPNYDTNAGDWYVTYEVKDEYKYLYDDNNGSPISAPCLIGNNSKWAKAGTGTIDSDNTVTVTGDDNNLTISEPITDAMLWYLKPNPTIDTEMGYTGSAITYNTQQKGFDPYNIQIRNGDQYFKTNASEAELSAQWTSNTSSLALNTSTASVFTATGLEGRTVNITNTTFMAVQDANGNMRLMPRFDNEKAITNLTGGTPTVAAWADDAAANDASGSQTIRLQPVQKYYFEVRDASSSTLVASSSSAFYARPGASLMTTLGDVSVPLHRDLIRSYCDYPAAYTSYDSGENTYTNEVTCYPPGNGSGISSDGVKIYVPYYVEEGLFAASADVANPSWYNIAFSTKNQFIQANTSTHAVSGSGTQTEPNSKWAFVGSPYDLKVFNQADRAAGFLKVDGSATCLSAVDENNHWTLLYNDNGNPIMRLKDTGTYIKKDGATQAVAGYPNDADFKIFLTNLVTVTYHVYHQNSNSSWPTAADYEESVDYELNQLEDYGGLPETVVRPLCEYTYYKSQADMEAGTPSYADFPALYTTLDATDKQSNMDIYLSYEVHYPTETAATAPVKFFATEEEARASMEWSFLMQGVESAAIVYGTQNKDYGHENARMGKTARTYGSDIASLKPAERTFTQHSDIPVMGGFHFIRRTSALQVDAATGAMTVPETNDSIGLEIGARYIPSQNAEVNASLMSPLNDFRRIAETYKDGKDTKFRENSWLWAFIGTPYKFEIINREALVGGFYNAENKPVGGTYKRLAQVVEKGTPYLKLVTNTAGKKIYWTLEQLDNYGDDETKFSFHIKSYDENKIMSRTSASTSTMRTINTPPISDIAYLKSTAFMFYPWNWTNNKYKTVTVNIYKDAVSGTPVLTKTYTPADRAFMAGDVIDGTDGHFYLPQQGTADGTSWKEKGVVSKTMPYDDHKINIPYELRRRYCNYTVEGGSFTVGATDAEQTLNIIYTVPSPPNAPYFVPANQASAFRSTAESGTFNGVSKKNYYYFVDLKDNLSQYFFVNKNATAPTYTATSNTTRFAAQTAKHAMFYFVGDPYDLRICNSFVDKDNGSSLNLTRNTSDNTTFMDNAEPSAAASSWEMVDANTLGSYGYNPSAAEVGYRLDYLQGKAFALRAKNSGANDTYYYLGQDGSTYGDAIYTSGSTPHENQLAAFRDYPDSRHLANGGKTIITLMRPVTINVSVYDQDEPEKLVTKNEESEFYAMSERFKGVPNNLQRNYCKYTWASEETKPSGINNRLTSDGYFVIPGETGGSREFNLYAKYEETDDSPFARLDEHGVPVLKKNPSKSPWYNMNIGTRWAFFNSNLTGQRYEINGKTAFNTNYAGKTNDQTELTFPYAGSSLPNAKLATRDRFHKGLHWALVGDPYNFQIRCQRDIIELTGEGDSRTPATDASGNYIYSPAYIKGAPADDTSGTVVPTIGKEDEATWWTWIRERSTNKYFLSESWTRRTEVPAFESLARSSGPRRLPIDYPQPDPSVNPPGGTLNFKINTADTFQDIASNRGVIARGDSYGIGDEMKLLSVDDVDANNECFDANVIVYNKVNEPVATSGWDEYARENARSNGRIDTDVQRWGCTYHYWADETMTRYPFKTFNQKDENGNYLIQDKGIVYVTYDYDENLYSSESEYRWMDIFYNWDHEGQTQMEWVNSPENSTSKDKDKAWCDQIAQTEYRDQKWAMIGDPYKFILYNYNRKVDATTNAYYLYDNGTSIDNHDFAEFSPSREKQQGIYFTWKVDGENYGFTHDGGTTYYKPAGLPETFFNFNGAGADKVQTGYLAVCDMTKTSLTDHDKLLGSIVGYTTFNENAAAADKYMTMTEMAEAAKRYLVMPLQQKAATVTFHLDPTGHTSLRDWATNPVFDFTTTDFGVDNTLNLPWMMRRQYCDYQFYVVNADGADPSTNVYVDALNYEDGTSSNAHRVETRGTGYTDFWKDGATDLTALTSMEIPDAWNGKHVYIRVTYQPTADFVTSTNTGATDTEKAASVHWMNIANQEQGNMLQYTRSQNVIGNSKENGANATNDLLWAVEGDPYGFKLHNRYAVAGTGTTLNANWATVLTTGKVNSQENVNYTETAPNFTFDTEGDPIIKSAITYGKAGSGPGFADAFGTMSSESTTNAVYEAMAGNYDGAMLIHPVNACINVRNQNGKKYYGAFLFNGAPTGYPVQLNYLQEWEAMRNVYANWRLEKPSAEQLYGYFERAGFVGGLTPAVATANAALFNKIKNKVALSDSEYNNVWELVQNPANLVQLTDGGYYRLRAYSSFDTNAQVQEQIGGHYVSGYLHKKEKDFKVQIGENEYSSPLHFYERADQSSNIQDLGFLYGNEWADGIVNRSLLEIPDPEFDPSSVFRISRESGTEFVKFETQGLVLNGAADAMTLIDMPEGSDLAAKNGTLYFQIQDIGQTAFQIRSKADAITTPNEGAYFGYSPSQENQRQKYLLHNDEAELSVYGGAHDTHIHSTKWLLEPVGTAADNVNAAGVTYRRPLKVKVNNASGNSYASLCLPFNWSTSEGMTASTGVIDGQVGGSSGTLTHYHGTFTMQPIESGKVKANQPVIIKIATTSVTNGCVEINLDEEVPTPAEENPIIKGLCLTQEIELSQDDENQKKKVFSFGGVANGNPKFMLNAVKDYTNAKNNLFMPHHKMYLLLTNDQTDAASKGLPIPVDYDIEEPIATGIKDATAQGSKQDGVIYDLLGRKVERITRPGVYIRNGKKFVVKKGEY